MSREFDIVVFGATGFVGELTARYLAESAPTGTKIALAGRSEPKLAGVRGRLGPKASGWPLIVADADRPSTLDEMCARTQVVCTTVGPYLKYGESLVTAAASAGTDYVDLTGEVPFVRYSIDKAGETAAATGARIVHACGFDSVPSDLGAYLLHRQAERDGAGTLGTTTMVVQSMRGGASGGTVDSVRVIAEQARDPQIRKVLLNPQALSSGPGEMVRADLRSEPSDAAIVNAKTIDPSLRGTCAPFFMSSFNTRIVRRSDSLLDYGPDFRYGEVMAVGGIPVVSAIASAAVAGGLGVGMGLMAFKPTRTLLDKVLPKPGSGPSEKARDKGHFTTQTFTTTSTGKRYRSEMVAHGDPGYKATAVMLGESALALALDRDRLPDRAGVLTPAVAMGDVLVERLQNAGFRIGVTAL
ncbi:MAG: saccharopine dehydrogenase NADP-binding domain-containing protein [Gordonia sp. (in: high G+C Gram-positive bacteria)]|uniref:saccharopine dehydrogenase family protein n=1 Tax=Gordonia sp. (in: high G+C Gram-positive bacteria) TaxID=84139 RepID=UPI0039E4FACE